MLNKTAYDYNKKWWHENKNPYNKYQLHHIMSRNGVSLCCLRLFYPAPHNHQLDGDFVGSLRERFRGDYLMAQKNWDKRSGCTFPIFHECNDCYFFKDLTKE